jgi:hypothetical protein
MIKYKISTGEVTRDGTWIGVGYSGQPTCKNDPEKCSVVNEGPIPPGRYIIGSPRDTDTHGPFVLPLTPSADNEMFGRSGFLIHGDSLKHPGTASHGCIILSRAVRETINRNDDRELVVEP